MTWGSAHSGAASQPGPDDRAASPAAVLSALPVQLVVVDGAGRVTEAVGEALADPSADPVVVGRFVWDTGLLGAEAHRLRDLLHGAPGGADGEEPVRWLGERSGRPPVLWSRRLVRDERGAIRWVIYVGSDLGEDLQVVSRSTCGERLAELVLSSISDAVFITDAIGAFTFVCPNVHTIFGYDYGEVWRAGNIAALLGGDLFDAGEVERVGELANLERSIHDKHGERHTLLVTIKRVSIDRGTLLFTCRDITQRYEADEALRASEERFRTIADYTYTWEDWVGVDGTLLWVNPAVERVTGHTVEECLAMPTYPLPLVHPEDLARFAALLERARSGGRVEAQAIRLRHRAGHTVWGAVSWQPIVDAKGRRLGYRSSTRDISEQHRAEELLRQRESELAHASRLSMMGEMSTGLAHELSQPLAAITNYAQACVRRIRAGAADVDELLPHLEQVSAQAHRAGAIVRRLRHFVKKQRPLYDQVDLASLLQEAVRLVAFQAQRQGVRIDLALEPGLPQLTADAIAVQQVVVNLLQNALEARGPAGKARAVLTVAAGRCRDDAEAVEVAVTDDGPGLAPDQLEQVFEPFVTTKARGVGLGLSISRSLVESHGGRLWAESAAGAGCTFRFRLPLGPRSGERN